MAIFRVPVIVTETVCESYDFIVEANSPEEAERKALEQDIVEEVRGNNLDAWDRSVEIDPNYAPARLSDR